MNDDPRYASIDVILGPTLPAVTRVEALRAYRRLVRAFGGVEHIPVGVLENRGGRPIRSNRTRCGFGWAASKPTTGHNRGWGRMIHDASHYVFRSRHPSARPHDGGHSQLERQMAEYVLAKGWFSGRLKPPTPTYIKPDAAAKLSRIETRITVWERKARRCATALRKLNKQAKYYRSKTNAPL